MLQKRRKSTKAKCKMQIAQLFDPICHSRLHNSICNGNCYDEDRSTNLSFRFPFNGTYNQDTLNLRSPSISSRPETSRIVSLFRKSLLVSRIAFSEEGKTEKTFARCEPRWMSIKNHTTWKKPRQEKKQRRKRERETEDK